MVSRARLVLVAEGAITATQAVAAGIMVVEEPAAAAAEVDRATQAARQRTLTAQISETASW
jgi:hypothetical protein